MQRCDDACSCTDRAPTRSGWATTGPFARLGPMPPMPPMPPGFWGHGRGRGRGRRGRGDVRAAILGLLAERPMHGYEMIQELENRTGGIWRPSPGSIYPAPQPPGGEGLISTPETG